MQTKRNRRVPRGLTLAVLALVAATVLVGCDTTMTGSRMLVVGADGIVGVPLRCSADDGECSGTVGLRVAGIDGPTVPYAVPSGGTATVEVTLTEDQGVAVPDTSWVSGEVHIDQDAPRNAGVVTQQVSLRRDGGSTIRVSASSDGTPASGQSRKPAISGDGRFVVFESFAANLVPGDTNNLYDVFLHDAVTRTTTRLSVGPGGEQANGQSNHPSISRDGRFVAFSSLATNLVDDGDATVASAYVLDRATGVMRQIPRAWSTRIAISGDGRYLGFSSGRADLVAGDTNATSDVFLHDLVAGTTTRVSVTSEGAQVSGASYFEGISHDGTVVFTSSAPDLVPNDTNGAEDVFVHDPTTGTTTRASVPDGDPDGNALTHSFSAAISGNGRYVAFTSRSTNLVPNDTNGDADVFVHDRVTAATERVSVATGGVQAVASTSVYRRTGEPSLSADGRFVAFMSSHRTLVPTGVPWIGVYVHDRATSTTTLASVSSDGTQPTNTTNESYEPAMAADASAIAFTGMSSFDGGESPNKQHVWLRTPLN